VSTTDGRVLGVIGVHAHGRLDTLYDATHSRGLPSKYSDNADYTRTPVEPRPEADDCTVVTPVSQYAFSLDDLARVADLVAEDTGMHRNAVLEALSRCKPRGTVIFK
jgi:hypothetical protein